MAEESRGTGACTVSASKEDSDDVAGSGFGKRHLIGQTVDGSTKAANNSNRLIGDRGTEFVRNGYRIVPPDHCAEIAAGCKLVVKAAIDDHECFALAYFPVHNAGQVNACLAHEPAAEFNGEFACLQYRLPLLQCFMEPRTDFFDVNRPVARKIDQTGTRLNSS